MYMYTKFTEAEISMLYRQKGICSYDQTQLVWAYGINHQFSNFEYRSWRTLTQ